MPPPPVSGAVVGNGRVDGMTVLLFAGCVAAVLVGCGVADEVCDPDEACDADTVCDADAVDVCDAAGVPDAGADAWAEVLAVAVDVLLEPAEALLEAPWPVGDGVRVPA